MFVGQIERNESGTSAFGEREISFTITEFNTLAKLEPAGTASKLNCDIDVGDTFEFDDNEVVQKDYFDDGPDGESEGSDTGNEGADFRQWYKATALLLVPANNAPTPAAPIKKQLKKK